MKNAIILALLTMVSGNALADGCGAVGIYSAGVYDSDVSGRGNVQVIRINRGDLRRFAIRGYSRRTRIQQVQIYIATKNKEPFNRWVDWTQYFPSYPLGSGQEVYSPCIAAKYYVTAIRVVTSGSDRGGAYEILAGYAGW